MNKPGSGLDEIVIEPMLQGDLRNGGIAVQAGRDDLGLERLDVARAATELKDLQHDGGIAVLLQEAELHPVLQASS